MLVILGDSLSNMMKQFAKQYTQYEASYEVAVSEIVDRALADSLRPKDLLADFSAFLESLSISKTWKDLYSTDSFGRSNSTAIQQYVRIFLSMQDWDDVPRLDSQITADLVYHLKDASNAAVYDSLSPDAQKFILYPTRSPGMWMPDVYLRTLSLLGSNPERPIKHNNQTNYRAGHKYFVKNNVDRAMEEIRENAVNPQIIDRLDVSPASIEFIETATSRLTANLLMTNVSAVDILTLWKALYTERVVMEMLERFSPVESRLDQHDLMNLMDDWDTWCDYPVEWILEMYSKKFRKLF